MAALVGGQGSDDSLEVALMADHGSSGIETVQVGSRGPGGGDVAIPAADHITAPMSNAKAQQVVYDVQAVLDVDVQAVLDVQASQGADLQL